MGWRGDQGGEGRDKLKKVILEALLERRNALLQYYLLSTIQNPKNPNAGLTHFSVLCKTALNRLPIDQGIKPYEILLNLCEVSAVYSKLNFLLIPPRPRLPKKRKRYSSTLNCYIDLI